MVSERTRPATVCISTSASTARPANCGTSQPPHASVASWLPVAQRDALAKEEQERIEGDTPQNELPGVNVSVMISAKGYLHRKKSSLSSSLCA